MKLSICCGIATLDMGWPEHTFTIKCGAGMYAEIYDGEDVIMLSVNRNGTWASLRRGYNEEFKTARNTPQEVVWSKI